MQGKHINTFNKGMHSDMNILFQPEGTLRFVKNCQIISVDGNNYSIKDCMGNVLTFQVNIPYVNYDYDVTNVVTYGDAPIVIGFISFPNKLIVFSTNNQVEPGDYGEIGQIFYDTYGKGVQPRVNSPTNTFSGYVPLYHHVSLKFNKQHQIEGFGFDENEIHQRVYWTDNHNEPRVLDVADPIYRTYIPDGSLVVGQKYMVLEGIVLHNSNYYSPDFTTFVGGIAPNIFTAANVNYQDAFGLGNVPTTAKVIKYYPFELLDWTPSRSLGNIKFNSYGTGNVLCGSKEYFYRLIDSANGLFSSWSEGSSPIPVGTVNIPASSPVNGYFDFVGGGIPTQTLNSGKSIKIDVDNIDTNFTRIQVACAEFDQILDVPRQISIVIDAIITGTSMTLEHTGSNNLGLLTISDITLFPTSILTCKTMTTDKNYILIGNIKERSEFNFDTSAITLSEIYSSFPVHKHDPTSCANVLTYEDLSPSTVTNPSFIIIGCQYIVTSGSITYNAITYTSGEVFTGVIGAFIFTGTGSVRPAIYRNRYTTTGGSLVPETIILSKLNGNFTFWTYKNPAVASFKLGYWAKETYRFGVLFYDLKGNPFYVRWIGDYQFLPIGLGGGDLMNRHNNDDYDYSFLNQRALSISGLTIPPQLIDNISGFSIVRADRDKRIITEGMLMQTGQDSGNNFKPLAGPTVSGPPDSSWSNSVNGGKNFTFICPDELVNMPMTNYAVGSNLEGVQFIDLTNYLAASATYAPLKSIDIDSQVETRYMDCKTDDGVVRKYKIVAISNVDEGTPIASFGTTNLAYQNTVQFGASGISAVDQSCTSSGTGNLLTWGAVAGRRSVVEIDNTIPYYSNSGAYGDLSSSGTAKLMMDVTIDGSSLYGGTSDTALANTLYISTGHFQPINAQVKADTLSGGNYVFNNIEVWGGDCYTCLIDYGHSLYDDQAQSGAAGSNSWGIKFPCQCNANYDLRRGRTVANNKMFKAITDNGIWYKNGSVAQFESFSYNYGYSSHGIEFSYPALPANFSFANVFNKRIRFAGVKFLNEAVNSFRNFFTNDYKDLDASGGEINNIRTKDARVIVWQNAITSTVPVLERQLLTGLQGAATTLGTGGVVDRYDPITSYFGNQHQWGLTLTEYGFCWFDMRKKALLILSMTEGLIEISKAEGMNGFFNEVLIDNLGDVTQVTPINSPEFLAESDKPIMGVGIIGVYDTKFKMTYMIFKFKQYAGESSFLNKDFSIAYYHSDKIFSHFSDWTPAIVHNHNGLVISSKNPQNKTKYYGAGMSPTSFVLGDIVSDVNSEYMCTVAGLVVSYVSPPSNTLFVKINTTNELWVNNQPLELGRVTAPDYQYNKYFGQVVDNQIDFVINPKTDEPFSVMAIEQQGNNVYPSTITIDDGVQLITENISPTSVNFRYIYDKICHNIPLGLTGRGTNKYLKVSLYKKNWTTDPRILNGTENGIQWIRQFMKSIFTLKR